MRTRGKGEQEKGSVQRNMCKGKSCLVRICTILGNSLGGVRLERGNRRKEVLEVCKGMWV